MLRLTPDLLADAMAHGTLDSLTDPVAALLLDGFESTDADFDKVSETAALGLVLDDLVDLACAHGDASMRDIPGLANWHTLGLTALLQSDMDHRLCTIASSRELCRQVANALGLDYSSVVVGEYAMHSVAALAASRTDFAKTCATARLQAAKALPAGVEPFYGINEPGTRSVQLAQQIALFVSVKADSASDARQMAHELHQWASSERRKVTLTFQMVSGHSLDVQCTPMMAGLPWTLRKRAAYEIHACVLSELADVWASTHPTAPRNFGTVLDFNDQGEVSAVNLVCWFSDRPAQAYAARIATPYVGELLDEKVSARLLSAGWACLELPYDVNVQTDTLALSSGPVPLVWDKRFSP